MNESQLQEAFSTISPGGFRYFNSISSTNDEALDWASHSASDFSVVVADEQTAGRGRSHRKWYTPSGSALAFSLILRPSAAELVYPARITGLGALALTDSLRSLGLAPKIKWPNDVLLNGRKVAGILVESVWSGDALIASVLGIGVNVLNPSMPPSDGMLFPPTSIESELGRPLERVELLKNILSAIINWRKELGKKGFIQAWEDALAYHGEQVQIIKDEREPLIGKLIGLELDGSLVIGTSDGNLQRVQFGEIHLRSTL